MKKILLGVAVLLFSLTASASEKPTILYDEISGALTVPIPDKIAGDESSSIRYALAQKDIWMHEHPSKKIVGYIIFVTDEKGWYQSENVYPAFDISYKEDRGLKRRVYAIMFRVEVEWKGFQTSLGSRPREVFCF